LKRPTVIIRKCPDYDVDRIAKIVTEGLIELDLRPHGKTLVKPNCVASGPLFPHAHTRPEFLEGVLQALKERADERTEEISLGERSGITIPTRFGFNEAKYPAMMKRVGGVRPYYFDEVRQVQIPLYHKDRLRDSLFTPKPIADCDFFVNCPKFKAHPWTTVTFGMKNYIGIQDDRHRLIDHDHSLNEKVADLQYIIQPQFIAIDAITAGEGRMLTPIPFDMGLVIMADNQVAFDAVCCHIIGLDPMSVDHIRMAHERGFGPVELDEIEITGDVTLDEAKKRASGFRVGLITVDEYFEGTSIRAYGGRPPGDHDQCWGGCPGALEEAIEILRLFDGECDAKLPRMHIVFGKYDGEIDAKADEKVFFMGDCATYHGKISGKQVDLPSQYVDRSKKDPLKAKHQGIYPKMWKVSKAMRKSKNDQIMRMAGCPVSVAEQVLMLVKHANLKNPYFDPRQAVAFNQAYISSSTRLIMKRIFGVKYNKPGANHRGMSRPAQNLPPEGVPIPLEAETPKALLEG